MFKLENSFHQKFDIRTVGKFHENHFASPPSKDRDPRPMLAALERRVYPHTNAAVTLLVQRWVGSDLWKSISVLFQRKTMSMKQLGTLNWEMFQFQKRFLNIEVKSSIIFRVNNK